MEIARAIPVLLKVETAIDASVPGGAKILVKPHKANAHAVAAENDVAEVDVETNHPEAAEVVEKEVEAVEKVADAVKDVAGADVAKTVVAMSAEDLLHATILSTPKPNRLNRKLRWIFLRRIRRSRSWD